MTGALIQLIRFAAVGLLSNALLYFLYLVLTREGMPHLVAMTSLYMLGVLQTFLVNKHWTFRHRGSANRSLIRYFTAYFGCYILNLCILHFLVDSYGFPHEIIQAVAIVIIAIMLFAIQKLWVFRSPIAAIKKPI